MLIMSGNLDTCVHSNECYLHSRVMFLNFILNKFILFKIMIFEYELN